MGMGDEDVGHRLAAHRIEECCDMSVVIGPGIEDCDLAAADDVADRALEGEWARVIGCDRPHQRCDFLRLVRCQIESLVEWNVIPHTAPATISCSNAQQ